MRQYRSGNDLIKIFVILGDFILLNVLLIGVMELCPSIIPNYFHTASRTCFLVGNIAMGISQHFFSTIIHYRRVDFEAFARRVFDLTFLQTILWFVLLRLLCDGGGFFRFMAIFSSMLYVSLLILRGFERHLVARLRASGRNTRSVIFIGNDPAILILYKGYMADKSTGYKVLGYYADKEFAKCPGALPYLGSIREMNQLMERQDREQLEKGLVHEVDEIFCCLSHDMADEIFRIMRFCDHHLVHFFYVPRMFGNFRLHLKPLRFGDHNLYTNHREPLSLPMNQLLKRLFDIVFSALVCILLLPFIPIIALIIKIQSPGPLIFRQQRTGLNGKTFTCYKFRSMHVNKAADTVQATKDDPRKFPFGEFMRRTNIDEFPQFFNVLKGDMSIVGPRPHMLHHTEIYSQLIDKYMVRHFSKPGITGWAQVTGFRGETKELWQMEERIQRDIWYIENWTFWLDFRIIFMTAWSIIHPSKNAY